MSKVRAVLVGTALVAAVCTSCVWSRSEPPAQCPAEGPESLADAVDFLDRQLSESEKERIRGYREDEYGGALHMGLGMWLRKNLGLWKDCPLTQYFNARGVEHADHMSGAILDSYWRHLRDMDYDPEAIIQCYRDWEAEAVRLKQEAESRGDKGTPFPDFGCPDRKSIYRSWSEEELTSSPG